MSSGHAGPQSAEGLVRETGPGPGAVQCYVALGRRDPGQTDGRPIVYLAVQLLMGHLARCCLIPIDPCAYYHHQQRGRARLRDECTSDLSVS